MFCINDWTRGFKQDMNFSLLGEHQMRKHPLTSNCHPSYHLPTLESPSHNITCSSHPILMGTALHCGYIKPLCLTPTCLVPCASGGGVGKVKVLIKHWWAAHKNRLHITFDEMVHCYLYWFRIQGLALQLHSKMYLKPTCFYLKWIKLFATLFSPDSRQRGFIKKSFQPSGGVETKIKNQT